MKRLALPVVLVLALVSAPLSGRPFRGGGGGGFRGGFGKRLQGGNTGAASDKKAFAPLVLAYKGFARLDANQDGVLDPAEMAAIRKPEVRQQVEALDTDKDGRIRKEDLRTRAVAMVQERAAKLPATMLERFDANKDGGISVAEAKQAGAREAMLAVLAGFDKNGDQSLAGDEIPVIAAALTGLAVKAPVSRLQGMLGTLPAGTPPAREFIHFALDLDGNGTATPEELQTFLTKAIGEAAVPYALGKAQLPNLPKQARPAGATRPPPAAAGEPARPPDPATRPRPGLPATPATTPSPGGPSNPPPPARPAQPAAPATPVTTTTPSTPTAADPAPSPAATAGPVTAPTPPAHPQAVSAQSPAREVLFPGGGQPGTTAAETEIQQDILGSDAENDLLW